MKIMGISALHHDAAVSVIHNNEIVFAGHSERYSKIKNDKFIHPDLMKDALSFGEPDQIIWYESSNLKKWRYLVSGQWKKVFEDGPHSYILKICPSIEATYRIRHTTHHRSHAAGGYYTSPFKEAVVVVIDAIGEMETITIWYGYGNELKKLHSWKYPFSLGLMYSAFTERCGFKPNEEEYIMMALAGTGEPKYCDEIKKEFITTKFNFHEGIGDWMPNAETKDIAASIQYIYEHELSEIMLKASEYSQNLVFQGGCALNCLANRILPGPFQDVWIMPNPGDAGASLGAAASLRGNFLDWRGPYLGRDIKTYAKEYPVYFLSKAIKNDDIVGVAYGRAEFGPRGLGNRSLFANPMVSGIKERLNEIKGRESFRPYGVVILESEVDKWFEPLEFARERRQYMQYVSKGKNLDTDMMKEVVHTDGTCRIQTVRRSDHVGLFELLTGLNDYGIPMLINTSLNLRGLPLINDKSDVLNFTHKTGIQIC